MTVTSARGAGGTSPLTSAELDAIDAWWRAANYLSVGQIYLLDNPLLTEELKPEHVKPRLLGHWGTTPGLNLLYAHLNRVIRNWDLDMIYIAGPGHGGPGLVANAYLEGTYTERYPTITQDETGMQRLFRQFSFPGGIPSHVAPETPGSIHEGGELGYSLAHAYGAAFDNPELLVACVIGDGEAETGPLAASWHSNKFLNPVTDGAVLPILHLNGYKIANPTVLARIPARRADRAADRLRVPRLLGGRRRPAAGAPSRWRRRWTRSWRRSTRSSGAAREGGVHRAAPLAGAGPQDAEGLDRAEDGGRQAGRGHLAGAPGADRRRPGQPRPPAPAGGVDALLPAGGAVRPGRRARAGDWRGWRRAPGGG